MKTRKKVKRKYKSNVVWQIIVPVDGAVHNTTAGSFDNQYDKPIKVTARLLRK